MPASRFTDCPRRISVASEPARMDPCVFSMVIDPTGLFTSPSTRTSPLPSFATRIFISPAGARLATSNSSDTSSAVSVTSGTARAFARSMSPSTRLLLDRLVIVTDGKTVPELNVPLLPVNLPVGAVKPSFVKVLPTVKAALPLVVLVMASTVIGPAGSDAPAA